MIFQADTSFYYR